MPLSTTTGLSNGVHYQASYEDYDATPALRPSSLARGFVDPRDPRRFSLAHYHQALSTERADTDALLLGRLVHALVLEPMLAARTFIRAPDIAAQLRREHPEWNPAGIKQRKDYKEAVAAWEASLPSSAVSVSPELWDMAETIADAALVEGGWMLDTIPVECREVSLVWIEDEQRLKRRSDAPHLELKTCRSLYGLERQIVAYGYDIQLAAERRGWRALAGHTDPPEWILAVEAGPPHAAALLPADEELVKFGEERLDTALREIALGERHGWTPASPGTDGRWGLPGWLRTSADPRLGTPWTSDEEED